MLRVVSPHRRTRPTGGPASRRAIGLTAAAAIAAGLLVGAPAVLAPHTHSAVAKPPPNPTDGQLNNANARKKALANQIGQLSGQLAAAQQRLTGLQNAAALAEQKVALAVSRYRDAVTATRAANAKTVQANKRLAAVKKEVSDEQTRFARYMQAIYMSGEPTGLTGSLLTSNDPSALLQQSTFEQYEVERKAGVIGTMQRLSVKQSNAEAVARRAEQKARAAQRLAERRKAESIEAQEAAAAAVQEQQQQNAVIQTSVTQTQTALNTASAELATLNGQRAKYNAYVERQREIARQRRLAEIARQKRLAEIERQKRLAAQRAAASGGSYSPPPPPVHAPPAPSSGGWSPAKAHAAVRRARSTLGMPYAWAGGGAGGPSFGACVPSAGAPYDCNVYGYDCSGLVMFAWGAGWDHYAATQYTQAGSVHPSSSQLRPGDLVFYSNGGIAGIHHVALYIGNGQIIEAPYSGGYVQYNSVFAYSDYYGATRPLT